MDELRRKAGEKFANEGVTLGKQGKYEEAIASYDKAIELKPDYADAWHNKGVILGKQGKYEEEIASYDKAIELKPDDAEAWYNKGVALGEQGKHEEAIASYGKAIELKPDYADAWCNKGVALGELGQHKEALACFDEVVKLKPDFAEAWYNKGITFQILGLESIRAGDMREADEQVLELVQLRREAEKDGMAQTVDEAVREFKEKLSERELKKFDEFELMFTLLAIEDPFERWRLLKREIGRRWPKGVSAVEAIREQRE